MNSPVSGSFAAIEPLRVLYVDDDRINTLLFVETCRPDPRIQVLCAGTGEEALALATEFVFDVWVIDLHLPDTDGLALLQSLRARSSNPALPAFLCTAEQREEAEAPAMKAGFDGVWIKPVQLPAVLQDISNVQAQRQERSASTAAPRQVLSQRSAA